jgi:putative NADH-flavin reductase
MSNLAAIIVVFSIGGLSLGVVTVGQTIVLDASERRAKCWEEVARQQGEALTNLMQADARLRCSAASPIATFQPRGNP